LNRPVTAEKKSTTTSRNPPGAFSGHSRIFAVAIFLLWVVIYLPGLFRLALLDDADSVHAEAAREILERHDWVTLHANGARYLEKAPLMYWTIAASFRVFGISEWSARLPLALGVLALLWVTYSLGCRAASERAGFYAAVVLATSFGPYIFSRILIPDLLVGLWLTLGLYFFLQSFEGERPSRWACWGLSATAALNVLTKGLIGLVFPVAITGLYLLLTRNLRHLLRMRLLSSAVVFLAIAAPWHILAALHNPDQRNVKGFLWFYFVNEHFLRYLNKRVPRDYDTVPLVVFWGLMLVWIFPWSAFVPQALAKVRLRARDFGAGVGAPRNPELLYAIWAAVILIFFSFSTRQEYYVLPAVPAAALLIGSWLAQESEAARGSWLGRWGKISAVALFSLGAIAGGVGLWLWTQSQAPPAGFDLADLLKKNPEQYALSFGHFFDLTPQALGAFRVPLLAASIALLLGTGLNWFFRRCDRPKKGNFFLAAMMAVIALCAHQALVIFAPVLSSKQLAAAIQQEYRPGEIIVINGEYESGSTLNFYTGKQVHILNGRSSDLWYGSLFPDAPQIFEDDASFARLWQGAQRVYVFSEKDRFPPIPRQSPVHEVAHSGGKVVLSNRSSAPKAAF